MRGRAVGRGHGGSGRRTGWAAEAAGVDSGAPSGRAWTRAIGPWLHDPRSPGVGRTGLRSRASTLSLVVARPSPGDQRLAQRTTGDRARVGDATAPGSRPASCDNRPRWNPGVGAGPRRSAPDPRPPARPAAGSAPRRRHPPGSPATAPIERRRGLPLVAKLLLGGSIVVLAWFTLMVGVGAVGPVLSSAVKGVGGSRGLGDALRIEPVGEPERRAQRRRPRSRRPTRRTRTRPPWTSRSTSPRRSPACRATPPPVRHPAERAARRRDRGARGPDRGAGHPEGGAREGPERLPGDGDRARAARARSPPRQPGCSTSRSPRSRSSRRPTARP